MPEIKIITDPKTKKAVEFKDGTKPRTGYKCPYTRKIFGGKKSYAKHLARVRNDMQSQRKNRKLLAERDAWWANLQATIETPDEIVPALMANQERLWDVFNYYDFRKDVARLGTPDIIKIELVNLQYSDRISNSHSSPRDGHDNWGGKGRDESGAPLPTGYPGWQGKIKFTVDCKKHKGYFSSELFEAPIIGIRTGGGSGGRCSKDEPDTYSSSDYDVKIFASDWPGMQQRKERDTIMRALSNDKSAEYS